MKDCLNDVNTTEEKEILDFFDKLVSDGMSEAEAFSKIYSEDGLKEN